jgi:lysozyme
LKKDCEIAERAVTRLVTARINQDIFDALVSLTFNIGPGNFNKSSVLRYVNAGNYYQSAMSFNMWINAAGRPLSGLIKRRAEEQLLFTIGCVKGGFIT